MRSVAWTLLFTVLTGSSRAEDFEYDLLYKPWTAAPEVQVESTAGCDLSPDGQIFVYANDEDGIVLRDPRLEKTLGVFAKKDVRFVQVADDSRVFYCHRDGRVGLIDFSQKAIWEVKTLPQLHRIVFHQDKNLILVQFQEAAVLLSGKNGRNLGTLDSGQTDFCLNGEAVALGVASGIEIRTVKGFRKLHFPDEKNVSAGIFAVSPDARFINPGGRRVYERREGTPR